MALLAYFPQSSSQVHDDGAAVLRDLAIYRPHRRVKGFQAERRRDSVAIMKSANVV